MTILGIPEGSGFSIGTSANIAPSSGAPNMMNMSLDDMIKSRRTAKPAASTSGTRARTATTADRHVAKGKAKRAAAASARRGLSNTTQPSAQQIEMEVDRQARRATSSTKKLQDEQRAKAKGRKPRSEADIKTKMRQEKKAGAAKKQNAPESVIPPTWIGGTRRPPSKKAVGAAVEAMEQNGFKVPKGMQMVITFAPAPDHLPTGETTKKQATNASNNNYTKKTNNNNASKGGGRGAGGGRGGGRGGRRSN